MGTDEQLPENLTLDEAYRAAYYMVEQYVALEKQPDVGLVLLVQYMESDPARWIDWIASVRRGLSDASTINPQK
ncbi:hypothetical protein [Actinacidiphila oryziradicis]|uniref:Uncharacterized protein n=1 Tax=Actinacidiphila oryziradicis TaxID=2571141 RepID=A0A4U0S1I2_9ACTN|nr:hypothetical protein [Actinacidiphila oryziradicis]TKA01983.1 hypothetical protein FCI23_39625 [Actinacidiphila oryziradicis]